jgi:hypothetical protein
MTVDILEKTAGEECLLVAVDLGTSAIKIVNPISGDKVRIVSCIGDVPEERPVTLPTKARTIMSNLIYEGEERSFLLGDAALMHSPTPRWFMYRGFVVPDMGRSAVPHDDRVEYAIDAIKLCIGALTPFKRKREKICSRIVIGVPAAYDEKYVEAFQRGLTEGEQVFTVRNFATGERKHVILQVEELQIWPQSFGSLYQYCKSTGDETFSGMVIDIGFGLTNICAFAELRPLRTVSATLPIAVGDVALKIRESLIRRGGGTDIPTVFALGELIKDTDPIFRSRTLGTVSLKEEKEKACLYVGQEIWREASFYVDRALTTPAASKLIISGGGSNTYLGDYLKSGFANLEPVVLGDIFANAEGLMLAARDLWNQE